MPIEFKLLLCSSTELFESPVYTGHTNFHFLHELSFYADTSLKLKLSRVYSALPFIINPSIVAAINDAHMEDIELLVGIVKMNPEKEVLMERAAYLENSVGCYEEPPKDYKKPAWIKGLLHPVAFWAKLGCLTTALKTL